MELVLFIIFVARSSADVVFEAFPISVAGINMTVGAILNLAILGMAGALIFLRSAPRFPIKVWLPFLLVAALSVFWSPDKGEALRTLLVLFTYAGIFAIPFFMRIEYRRDLRLLKAIIYSSILPAIFGVLEYMFFRDPSGRVKSTFLHPNVFAFYLTVVVGIICFLLSSSTVQFKPFIRKIMIPYMGLLLALIILTATRSAWAGVLIILMAFSFLVDRRYLLVLLVLPALVFVPAVSDRLDDLGRGTAYTGTLDANGINSLAWRELMWTSALNDAADSRILGKGLASFGPNSLRFFPLVDPHATYSSKGVGAHSVFIQTMYETGLIGLVCYLGVFVSIILRAVRHFRRDPGGSVMLISIVISYMAESYSDNIFDYGSLNLYFWGFLGIVLANWQQQSLRSHAHLGKRFYRNQAERFGLRSFPKTPS